MDCSIEKMATRAFECLLLFRDMRTSNKLALCCYTFDFTDPTKNVREKEIKRQRLLELVDYVTVGSGKFTKVVFEDITRMLAANLFRMLLSLSHENTGLENLDSTDDRAGVAASTDRVRVFAAVRGVKGDGCKAGKAIHPPLVCVEIAGPVQQQRPLGWLYSTSCLYNASQYLQQLCNPIMIFRLKYETIEYVVYRLPDERPMHHKLLVYLMQYRPQVLPLPNATTVGGTAQIK